MMSHEENEDIESLKEEKNIQQNNNILADSKYRSFKQIVNNFYNERMEEIKQEEEKAEETERVKIEPRVIYDKFNNTL